MLTSNITPYRSGLDLLPPSLATVNLSGTVELLPLANAPAKHVAKAIDVARPAPDTDLGFMTSQNL